MYSKTFGVNILIVIENLLYLKIICVDKFKPVSRLHIGWYGIMHNVLGKMGGGAWAPHLSC